jgi:hypothetical protein
MPIDGLNETLREKSEGESREEMEQLSLRLKELILSLPPRELLGYIRSTSAIAAMFAADDDRVAHRTEMNLTQFVLEYIHAALSSSVLSPDTAAFDESVCADIFKTAEALRGATTRYCMYRSLGIEDGVFGDKTGEIYQFVQSNWVLMRGNRYGRLEEEFFEFVLKPHDDMLRETYGLGASDIAAGIQQVISAMAGGHASAADRMEELMKTAEADEARHGLSQDQVMERWKREHPERLTAAADIYMDLFQGGVCNLSKHTCLPVPLLEDLSYERGGNTDFYAPGQLSGTPLRTLPARIRPLIKIDDDFFAADNAFVRDSTYRALLLNLLQRNPAYRTEFETRQKDMSETAFAHILHRQLPDATVQREVWYKDTDTRQWVENDTLICIDDVLLLVEAKSGAAATVASPATNFDRHTRAIHDLITKAYSQCARFFRYVHSADEVPLFKREGGRYVETVRLRARDFRLMMPIGLTVESFSPYASLCKEFPGIESILGRYPFMSMSIDDVFVLARLLPTAGEFFHYLETRQNVAGMKGAFLYDEMDHLGAYISNNRFDLTFKKKFTDKTGFVWWDGACDNIDAYFASEDLETVSPPRQEYPVEVQALLNALDASKERGWLAAESHIRTLGDEGRENLATMLSQVRLSLSQHVSRYFQLGDDPPLFVWLHRTGHVPDLELVRTKASAGAITAGSPQATAILAYVNPGGTYARTVSLNLIVPSEGSPERAALRTEVESMSARKVDIPDFIKGEQNAARRSLPRPNEPCWCGSGKKYKKCHGI